MFVVAVATVAVVAVGGVARDGSRMFSSTLWPFF